jgi:hypothetical protein
LHIFGLTKDAQFGQVLSVTKTAKDRRLRIPSKTYLQCQRARKKILFRHKATIKELPRARFY